MDSSVPEAFIFMKVGDYGGECLEGIIERKNREWEKAKKMFWGYGATGLHPTDQVKRFVEERKKEGLDSIEVLMERTRSNPKKRDYDGRKKENLKKKYSKDGKNWKTVPPEIRTDSMRALVLDEIRACHMDVDLRDYKVVTDPDIDPSKGKYAIDYLAFLGMKKLTGKTGRKDKGCLVKAKSRKRGIREAKICITYRAYLKDPYAVFLK